MKIPVKQCVLDSMRKPRFYAEVGDEVAVRGADGKSFFAAILEAIDGDRVSVRRHPDEELLQVEAGDVTGIFLRD